MRFSRSSGFFKNRTNYVSASVAQLIEHLICNEDVLGLNPSRGLTRFLFVIEYRHYSRLAQLVVRLTVN